MKPLLGVPIVAAVLTVVLASTAEAGYCGAARYRCCASCCDTCGYAACKQQCHTVMKCCKEVVYEKQNYTCYKTVYETVYSLGLFGAYRRELHTDASTSVI